MLRRRSGVIVNLTSVVGLHGNPGQANYAASKAGIIGLTKALARELGSRGVRVNAVAPGYIDTALTDVLSEELRGAILANTPLGRLGEPEDVAGAVRFLCSDEAAVRDGRGAAGRRRPGHVGGARRMSVNGRRRVVITGRGRSNPARERRRDLLGEPRRGQVRRGARSPPSTRPSSPSTSPAS